MVVGVGGGVYMFWGFWFKGGGFLGEGILVVGCWGF